MEKPERINQNRETPAGSPFFIKPLRRFAPMTGCGSQHPLRAMHLWIAGRGPNNSSLFPPLAAVVVVAPDRGAKSGSAFTAVFLPLLLGEVASRSDDGEVKPRWQRTSSPANPALLHSGGEPASQTLRGGRRSASPARPGSGHRAPQERWQWAQRSAD